MVQAKFSALISRTGQDLHTEIPYSKSWIPGNSSSFAKVYFISDLAALKLSRYTFSLESVLQSTYSSTRLHLLVFQLLSHESSHIFCPNPEPVPFGVVKILFAADFIDHLHPCPTLCMDHIYINGTTMSDASFLPYLRLRCPSQNAQDWHHKSRLLINF